MRWLVSYTVVSRVFAVVLLTAGGLSVVDTGSNWKPIVVAFGEVVFGLWLLVGFLPAQSWYLLTGCFLAFFGVAFAHTLAGETSCGCFGRASFHPGVMAAADVVAVIVLCLIRPAGVPRKTSLTGSLRLVVPTIFAVMIAAGVWVSVRSLLAGEATPVAVLEPQTWVGKPLPVLEYIDVGEHLTRGRWTVVFYRRDCAACRAHLARLGTRDQLALIEVPTGGGGLPAIRGPTGLRGSLDRSRDWVVRTPVVVELDAGVTLAATTVE